MGPRPGHRERDGSFIDAETAVTHHAYSSDGFRTLTGEISALGRYDLSRFDESLAGSFVETGVGWALSALDLDAPGPDLGDDTEDLLLFRFGYGFYVGRAPGAHGEVGLHYDHRHDDYAAGLKLGGLGSGVAGHFVLSGKAYFSSEWGMLVDLQAGSAYIAGLSLLYRAGGGP